MQLKGISYHRTHLSQPCSFAGPKLCECFLVDIPSQEKSDVVHQESHLALGCLLDVSGVRTPVLAVKLPVADAQLAKEN